MSAPVTVPAPAATLCLDFANTLAWRGRVPPEESLTDLLAWAGAQHLAPPEVLRGVRWDEATALAEAVTVREALWRLFATGPQAADLAVLNAALAQAPARRALTADLAWRVRDWTPTVACVLAPVLWSAADLLAGAQRGRARACANPECRWLFLDDSRAGARRWCSMAACGNRAKARRHYRRKQEK